MSPVSRQKIVQAIGRFPIYRVLPPGALRTYAALRYHAQNSSRTELVRVAKRISHIPARNDRLALAAARAAFRAGQDDLVEAALAGVQRRHPDSAAAHLLRSDLLTYRADFAGALKEAQAAYAIEPQAASAVARTVRLSYRTRPVDEADRHAVDAVALFPHSSDVMWSVARECTSPSQFGRIRDTWTARAAAVDPLGSKPMARQLATAATRAREIDVASAIYRNALIAHLEQWPDAQIQRGRRFAGRGVTPLAGRAAWSAIEDLVRVLDGAGVPFFFAAGTALGFVREGGPLSSDTDVDVGIFAHAWDRDALIAMFTADAHFDVEDHPLSGKVHVIHRGGTPIDVFRFYEEGGAFWHDGVFVRWRNRPFDVVRRTVRNLGVPLPSDEDTYLTENYGDWRTPTASFDPFTDDAPNVEVTWPEYQRMHLIRRAYKQILAGDAVAARASLVAAGDSETLARLDG